MELYHHGIKGQKWGVRRFQNKDGSLTPKGVQRYQKAWNKLANKAANRADFTGQRTIPKGMKVYRTTANNDQENNGSTYVSYLDVDRNHYKGGWIRKMAGTDKAYEREYTLKEDLKIPSRSEVQSVVQDVVLKNKKLLNESIKSWVDTAIPEGSVARWEIKEHYGTSDAIKRYTNDMIKDMSKAPIEESFYTVAQSLGLAKNVKGAIIGELSKRGYNAMVDEGSVGGNNGWNREGVDPLIVFDNKVMEQTSSREISRREEAQSNKADTKWQRKAMMKRGAWSAIKPKRTTDILCP